MPIYDPKWYRGVRIDDHNAIANEISRLLRLELELLYGPNVIETTARVIERSAMLGPGYDSNRTEDPD